MKNIFFYLFKPRICQQIIRLKKDRSESIDKLSDNLNKKIHNLQNSKNHEYNIQTWKRLSTHCRSSTERQSYDLAVTCRHVMRVIYERSLSVAADWSIVPTLLIRP